LKKARPKELQKAAFSSDDRTSVRRHFRRSLARAFFGVELFECLSRFPFVIPSETASEFGQPTCSDQPEMGAWIWTSYLA
jgi:hypothetical protein